MKIKISKSKWNTLQKSSQSQEYKEFMESLDPSNPAKIQPAINLKTVDKTLVPASDFDRRLLDKLLGKHEFNIFSAKEIERKLTQGTKDQFGNTMNESRDLLIDGMGVDKYMDKIKGKTASTKITISKAQWEFIGKQAGWLGREPRKCSCGSGQMAEEDFDARGISIGFSCPKCKQKNRAKYRQEIFNNPNYEADEPIEPEE